jgi:cytochrome c peroxidase
MTPTSSLNMIFLVRRTIAILGCVAGLGLSGCFGEGLVDGIFTAHEWQEIQRFSPLPPMPSSPTNRYADDPGAAALGQKLFFEKRYSGLITLDHASSEGRVDEAGKFSCASCHDPGRFFIDTRSRPNSYSVGASQITRRNSPSLVNIAYYEWGGWAGAQDQVWKQGASSLESKDLNGDRLGVAHMLYALYRAEYNAVFDPDLDPALDPAAADAARFPARGKPGDPAWEAMTAEDKHIVNQITANVGKALEAYQRRLISRDAPFDDYVAGNFDAISASAKRGLELFAGKAGCDACHSGPAFTDQKFHNTAVWQKRPFDNGRYDDILRFDSPFTGAGAFSDDVTAGREKLAGVVQTEEMLGQFRTKSLRHVAQTGPYFHDGSVDSLVEVVRHYNRGGALYNYPGVKDERMVPLHLTDAEIYDIAAFLRTLTGQPVPPELTIDTSAP